VTIGHDQNWHPVIAVLSSVSDPVSVKSVSPETDIAEIQKHVAKCFEDLKRGDS
jgi:hypothetical protein